MAKRKTILFAAGLVVVVAIGVLLYALVDHYAVGKSDAIAAVTTQATPTASTADSDATSSEATSWAATTADTTTVSYESVDANGNGYTATDTSYVSDTASIEISKVVTGSDADTITYFVADVRLAAGTDLQAGLAGDGQDTADTSDIATACDALFAVNGDYFGARDDGIIIRNGEIYRDDGVRTGLALYEDGHMEVYDETQTSAQELLDNGVWNTISFGPGLLVNGEMPDNISAYEVESNPKHPIQGRDPRTGIGIIDNNHFVFVVVDGRNEGYSKGVTMEEFAQIFKDLGCTTAYNLDGGGSSTMYFMGDVINDPANKGGQRSISDILFVG